MTNEEQILPCPFTPEESLIRLDDVCSYYNGKEQDVKNISDALKARTPAIADGVGVEARLREYYLPTLKFNMEAHLNHANSLDEERYCGMVALHHGAANAFELAIGCIEEALGDSTPPQAATDEG